MKNFKFTILKNQLALFLGVWCLMVGVSANAQTYTRSTSAGTTLVPITSPTNQNMTDDQFVQGIDMGFNFPYYGGNYNTVAINANGFLRFTPNAGTGGFTNQNLSTNCGTNFTNLLAVLWDDWSNDAGTNVQWGPTAAGGFAVTFVRQGFSYLGGQSGNYATFQVVLSPNGTINYIYNDIDLGSGTGNFGGTATVGINGNNSGECDQFSFNTSIAGTGTLTYTPSTLIQSMSAAAVSTCSSNGTTYNQPVTVNFNSAPVAGTVFQVCYQSACAQNQPTNSNFAAAPYACQTFMASGGTSQSVTLANIPCNAMTSFLYGLYGPTGGSQPIYIGCVGTQGATFTSPAGLPCELVCPSNQTLFAGSLEDCVVAFYDLKTFGNCAQPFSFGPVTALNTAISQNLVSVTLATTGASGQSATRNGNVITLTSGTGTSTATASLRFTYGGTFSAAWSYVNNTDPFFDPFTWQLIRGGTVVQSFSTASACSNLTCSGSITNLAVQPNDILLFTQSGDFIFGPVSTTITFQSLTASGSTTLTPVVAAGSLAPGSCFPIGNNSVTINLINPISGAVVNSCTFNVNVVPNPATGVLVCNDHVNISLSDGCTAVIRPDDVLEGSQYGPSSRYEVAVSKNPNGPWLVPTSVNQSNCGDWYYRVRDKVTNNTCWGTLTVEDKIAPSLACGACPGNLAGIIELSDINGQFVGFGASPIPAPGATCGANFFTRTDYVQFTLPSTGSGNYKFTLTSSLIITGANLGSQLGLALYNGQPNPNNSCQNNIRIDGQSLNGVPETINGHFNNVALTPGATYWIGVQQPRHALGSTATFPHDWAVNVIDLATGQNALTSPENCAVDCVDKPALLDFIAKGQINNLVALGIPTPVATGGYCGGTPQYTVKLKNDNSTSCGGFIVIEWGVTEACGAKAFVDCRIKVNPMKFEDVELPAGIGDPLYIHCKDGTTPEEIAAEWGVENAFPYFVDAAGNKQPISGVCNFYASYADISLDACAPHCHGNKKVIRKWTLLDWCTGSLAEATQIIKAVDQEAPTFTVKDTVVSTRPWDCTAEFYLPRPWELHDNCDANPRYEVIAPEGVWVSWDAAKGLWRASGAELGVTTFTYKAYDCCGNIGAQTIDVRVTDRTAPVAVAKQNIVISLVPGGSDGAGQAKMFVESVDNGSFDNCTGVRMEIRRMDNANCTNVNVGNNGHNNNSTFSNSPIPGFTNSANDTDGGQFVKFCCADIDAAQGFGIVKVELRVWDDANGNGNPGDVVQGVADNYNVTWVDVRVETKIPPVITCPPAMTIFCDWAIDQNVGNGDASAKSIAGFDFSKTGLPSAYGVCGAADIKFWDREVLDQCDLGYIDRTFLVTNNGQTVKCVQRITVQQSPAQAPWVFIPSSLSENPIATSCDGPTQADIERNAPKYTAGPCDVIGVSTKVHQFDFESGVCRKWKVEYKYVNWCTNEERGPFVKNFAYEDKVAPVMTCADQMFEVDGNCERVVELKKSATDAGGCVDGGWLKWEVYVDLWADGSQDLFYSSFYAGPQGAVKTIVINGVAHVVRQYTLAPTTSGQEAKFTLPEPIVGKVSNHKVVWKVTDGCHNWESCHEEFMVADKKAPTPVCVPLTTALMQDPDGSGPLKPMVELWAIDFMNKSYDNCTDESDLLYTFEGWAPQVTLKLDGAGNPMSIDHPHFFNANGGVASAVNTTTSVYKAALTQYQLGNLQLWIPSNRSSAKVWVSDTYNSGSKKEVDVKVTVWDKRFNSDYCWTTLGLLHGGDGAAPRIAGNVSTAAGQAVNNVIVSADDNVELISASTGSNGNYTMEVVAGRTYEITASKTGDFLNGVSTLDLVMIQRHILGLQKLDNPYKLIAADVNNDGKVTASDLTELRKLILGITPAFTNNASWRFPVKSQTLDANNPFPFVEMIGQEVLGTDVNNLDFVAVKIGDVNGNVATNVADPMTEGRSNKAVVMAVADQAVVAGDVVSVPVTAANFNEVMGYQFTMKLNGARFAGIEAGAINVDASNVGVLDNGMITMSFASNEAVSANEGAVLFTLVLNADKAGNVSEMIAVTSDVTAAESYNADLEVGKVSLDVRTAPVASIELFQNEPNPFRGQTTVTFNMPVAAKATLSIYDVTGKVVTVRNIDAVKGMNSEIFTREQVGATGVLYYTLESGDFTATKKMIIIE